MEEALLGIVTTINNYLSNYILIILLLGMGIWFTVRTKAIQFRCFGEGWRRVFGNFSLRGGNQGGGMTSFQALSTAIAAQVGTGNIVGACGAIIVGGPGAIFWMWIIALLGMATNYAEAVMAQKTRVVDEDGTVHGGPVYYITTAFKGKGGKFLAGFFAVAIILALGFMGCMVQSNSIAETMNTAFGIPTWVMGLIVVILAGTVFIGGVSRLAAVTEKIVPIMAVLYVLGSLVVLIMNAANIPATFALIFQCAFNPDATVGGATFGIIAAISQGAKRGLFSNEAGIGAAACAAGSAGVSHPAKQGLVQVLSVFIDTIVVCTATAMLLLCSGVDPTAEAAGMPFVQQAMAGTLGQFGVIFITVALFLFAFTTLLGNFYYAETGLSYLFNQAPSRTAVYVQRAIATVVVCLGATMQLTVVWDTADVLMGLMALINVPVIVLLLKPALRCLDDYIQQKKSGKNPEFKASSIGLKEKVDFWN